MPQNHRSLLLLLCLPSERHFGALTMKLSLNPIMTQMMGDLQNCVTSPLNHRFHSFIYCLSSEQHFGAVSVKFSLYRITAQKVTTLQNTVRRLIIIVLSFSYNAYNQSVTFKLLR